MRKGQQTEDMGAVLLAIALAILILLIMTGCKHTKQIVSDTLYITKYETEYRERIDSIYIEQFRDRWIEGDTVYMRETNTEYRYKFATDTINATDTLYITRTAYREAEETKKPKTMLLLVAIFATAACIYTCVRIEAKNNATK